MIDGWRKKRSHNNSTHWIGGQQGRRRRRTVLVDEAVHAGAARTAVEPEHDGVPGRVALRLHQVVEEPAPDMLVHRHVPGVVLRRQLSAVEPGETRHERTRRRRRAAAADHGGQQEKGCCGGRAGHCYVSSRRMVLQFGRDSLESVFK